MHPLIPRLASHVHDFAESWQAYAYSEHNRLVSLRASGAATAEQAEGARVTLDLATCLLNIAAEVMNAGLPPPPP